MPQPEPEYHYADDDADWYPIPRDWYYIPFSGEVVPDPELQALNQPEPETLLWLEGADIEDALITVKRDREYGPAAKHIF